MQIKDNNPRQLAYVSDPTGPLSSIGSPITLMMRPRVFGPTGILMGESMSRHSCPRTKPSVPSIAMVRTVLSPAYTHTRMYTQRCTHAHAHALTHTRAHTHTVLWCYGVSVRFAHGLSRHAERGPPPLHPLTDATWVWLALLPCDDPTPHCRYTAGSATLTQRDTTRAGTSCSGVL